jgi:hypothetical protein
MTKAPCNFTFYRGPVLPLLFAGRPCSCPVVYRVTGPRQQRRQGRACVPDAMQHGRSVLQPLDVAQPHLGCGHRCIADPGPDRAPASRGGGFETRPYQSRTQSLRGSGISGALRRAGSVRAGCKSACGASCCTASGTRTPSSPTSGDMNRGRSCARFIRAREPNPVHDWTSHVADAFRCLATH